MPESDKPKTRISLREHPDWRGYPNLKLFEPPVVKLLPREMVDDNALWRSYAVTVVFERIQQIRRKQTPAAHDTRDLKALLVELRLATGYAKDNNTAADMVRQLMDREMEMIDNDDDDG